MNNSQIGNFIKSTVTHSSTSYSRATSVHPIGSAFMYVETTHNIHGHNFR